VRILIVGAGIAGLSAAKAFEDRGYKPEIVERSFVQTTSGQSIFLLGNAMRALREIGLEEHVSSQAHPINVQTILSSDGSVLHQVATDSVWTNCGPCVALLRATLSNILRASLKSTIIQFGTSVIHTIARGDRRDVHFSDGRVASFDLVIGADGIYSSMRAWTRVASAPCPIGLSAWRLMIDNRHGIDQWTAMLGAGRTLLGIPTEKSMLYLYADCSARDFGDGSVKTLKELYSKFAAPLGPIVQDLDERVEIHRSNIEEVKFSDLTADRLILIGDAAHASSPSMAQGAAMALEDAIVLATCVSREKSIDGALTRFKALRKPRIEWVQKQAQARDKLRRAPAFARNILLRSLGDKLYQQSYASLAEELAM
jgi:2-polyprenyl-6-methoxyphenol hydroxylase-like FAD-dependent oxidoreductase